MPIEIPLDCTKSLERTSFDLIGTGGFMVERVVQNEFFCRFDKARSVPSGTVLERNSEK